jgi:hypothetical protein
VGPERRGDAAADTPRPSVPCWLTHRNAPQRAYRSSASGPRTSSYGRTYAPSIGTRLFIAKPRRRVKKIERLMGEREGKGRPGPCRLGVRVLGVSRCRRSLSQRLGITPKMPPTTSCSFGDILLVPFPFTDASTTKKRPAVVVSSATYNAQRPDLVLMPITSRIRPALGLGEVLVGDWKGAGLLFRGQPSDFRGQPRDV